MKPKFQLGIFKGLILTLTLTFVSWQAHAQIEPLPPLEALDVITNYVGRSFNKEMGKAKIPLNCKIYALPFRCERDGIDTFATPLGMKISAELSFKFKRVIQNEKKLRNQNISIISPDNTNKQLFELMAQNLNPPSSYSEESEFWKNVNANQKPDYYLVGKYEIKGDYKSVRVSDVELIKDKLNPKLAGFQDKIILKDIDFPFESEDDRETFRKLDTKVGEIEKAYARLVNLASKGQFASVSVVDEKTDQPIDSKTNLKVGKGYQLKMNLLEDAYIYAFYYESNDLTGNKMYMIYPFEDGMKNFMKKGAFNLPDDENVFSPSPPAANQVFIKLIASRKMIPLKITTTQEGYKFVSPEDCFRFVSAMDKIPVADIDSNNLIRGVSE